MKKIFLTLSSIYILLLSNPIFAQIDDPGDDPDSPLPIDDYLWVLVALGLIFVFFKYRAMAQQKKI